MSKENVLGGGGRSLPSGVRRRCQQLRPWRLRCLIKDLLRAVRVDGPVKLIVDLEEVLLAGVNKLLVQAVRGYGRCCARKVCRPSSSERSAPSTVTGICVSYCYYLNIAVYIQISTCLSSLGLRPGCGSPRAIARACLLSARSQQCRWIRLEGLSKST